MHDLEFQTRLSKHRRVIKPEWAETNETRSCAEYQAKQKYLPHQFEQRNLQLNGGCASTTKRNWNQADDIPEERQCKMPKKAIMVYKK